MRKLRNVGQIKMQVRKKRRTSERASEFVGSKLRNIDLELFFESDILPHIEKTPKKEGNVSMLYVEKVNSSHIEEKNAG